ncbi:hypothetical protein S7711_10866 [Stachybotrys chartarum IBT 7711]|uniref:Uncharacterized protein n=1 Tax=Stachybotrys chartarum (strain CBS 109288 / IBT 7711) TaxID=1280523 RepID=A0A084AUK1_STACB|nr:hypothetical protein S7711_10866 [Stachybotrys chartarum IBT 7711]KFA52115.1 hypothetical protein S40293_10663 [Stachybotrys chartarum IBT 40293]KFA73393.1 hypothetical protein S40288_11458 [Stachybotrys chartarum IBT 40288]
MVPGAEDAQTMIGRKRRDRTTGRKEIRPSREMIIEISRGVCDDSYGGVDASNGFEDIDVGGRRMDLVRRHGM